MWIDSDCSPLHLFIFFRFVSYTAINNALHFESATSSEWTAAAEKKVVPKFTCSSLKRARCNHNVYIHTHRYLSLSTKQKSVSFTLKYKYFLYLHGTTAKNTFFFFILGETKRLPSAVWKKKNKPNHIRRYSFRLSRILSHRVNQKEVNKMSDWNEQYMHARQSTATFYEEN